MCQDKKSVYGPEAVKVESIETVSQGFLKTEKVTFTHTKFDGSESNQIVRERVVRGDAAHILLFDAQNDLVCLTKQIRPCVIDTDSPYMIELVAGMIDEGETAIGAAVREAKEEVGVDVSPFKIEIVAKDVFLAPGSMTERTTILIGNADLADVPEAGGMAGEDEDIQTVICSTKELEEMLLNDVIRDLPTIVAGQMLLARRMMATYEEKMQVIADKIERKTNR